MDGDDNGKSQNEVCTLTESQTLKGDIRLQSCGFGVSR